MDGSEREILEVLDEAVRSAAATIDLIGARVEGTATSKPGRAPIGAPTT